jgi:hypothetical protein
VGIFSYKLYRLFMSLDSFSVTLLILLSMNFIMNQSES